MDTQRLKAEFGEKITFHGAVDLQHAMTGQVEDVDNEVKLRIGHLAPGGGYILATCSNFQADVPPENTLGMIEAARKYGRYPVN